MKAPKEIKRWIAKQRRRFGKGNGVVPYLFDAPEIERKIATNKRTQEPTP